MKINLADPDDRKFTAVFVGLLGVIALIVVVGILTLSVPCGYVFQFFLWRTTGQDVPFIQDMACGVVAWPVVLPLSLALLILGWGGMTFPLN